MDFQKICDGDPVALQSWFQDHVDGLYGFIYYRVVNDPQAAADVTQSTFERALEKLDQFDPERGTMSTWLRLTSRNLIRDYLKVSQRDVPLQDLWARLDEVLVGHFSEIDDRELPSEVLERSETRELVSMTLAVLPDHYREVLDAKYLDEQTPESMAYDAMDQTRRIELRDGSTAIAEHGTRFVEVAPRQLKLERGSPTCWWLKPPRPSKW